MTSISGDLLKIVKILNLRLIAYNFEFLWVKRLESQ